MTKKTKQWVTIVGLIVLLAATGAGYYGATVYEKQKAQKEAEQEDSPLVLYSMQEDQIQKIHIKTKEKDVTYKKIKGIWRDASDAKYPVNQDKIADILGSVAQVEASKLVVENPKDLQEYQLDTPAYEIQLEDEKGNVNFLAIGLESIAAEGYYAYTGKGDKVYTVGSGTCEYLDYTWGEMMELPEAPDIAAANVTAYKVSPKKGKAWEAVYNEKRSQYKDYEGWDIKGAYDTVIPGSSEGLQSVFGSLTSLECNDGVSYNATTAQKKQYGLETPAYVVDVSYYTVETADGTEEAQEETAEKTEHVYKLFIGHLDAAKEQYYVAVEGEPGIYTMSADTINALVQTERFSLLCKTPHIPNADTLQKIVMEQKGTKHVITFRKEEVENAITEDDSIVYNYYVKLDGKDVDQEAFRNTYSTVFEALQYRSEITDAHKAKDDTPVGTLQITTEDRKLTLQFLPYDGVNFYRISVDGQCKFLVDKNVADAIFTKLAISSSTNETTKAE